jgi:hypothetical protein
MLSMPKERGRVPPPKETKEDEPKLYSLAARFADEQSSARPYREAQELIYQSEALALSAFRLQLERLDSPELDWHVAVVGEQPPAEFDQRFRQILSTGESVTLPDEVLSYMRERRAEAAKLGDWVEAHYGTKGLRRRL